MRLFLDGKSVAVGVFAGAALVGSLGALQKGEPAVGRFQISAAGAGTSAEAYVVDTATGQVWSERPEGSKAGIEFRKAKLGGGE